MHTILVIILILLLIGVLPTWQHSAQWGYLPGGIVGVILLFFIFMLLAERL